MTADAPRPVGPAPDGKDSALSEDIRLLGRIVGDVVRRQEGEAVFEVVEQARRSAVDARRTGESATAALRAQLGPLPIDDALDVIRAFSWFSLLANTAEDVHHERRRRHHRSTGGAPQPASIDAALDRLRAEASTPRP